MNLYGFYDGIVVDNDDVQQNGRMKVWVPALDGDNYEINDLPWTEYISPFAGQTMDYPAGENASIAEGYVSYGFWSIPKNGAIVVIGLLHGDANLRFYIGSKFRQHGNRSLPAGRYRPDITNGPLTDTYSPLAPHFNNLKAQFSNKLTSSEAKTRGAYERMVAQDKTLKDGGEGYQESLVNTNSLESQTTCIVSPGRHAIIMQDHPSDSRTRIKTASGHQIILDDANERIYISTARGNNYIEMDIDGRIYVYAANDIGVSAGGNINISAGGDLNLSGKNVNISATGNIKMSSCANLHLSGADTFVSADGNLHLKAASDCLLTSASVFINSAKAAEQAECAQSPSNIPEHEPWVRPASVSTRNKYWKP